MRRELRPVIRPTLHFFLIGAGLLALRVGWDTFGPAERPWVEVVVPAEATDAEVRALIDEHILVAEAVRLGWLTNDPVIRRQLVSNMRFVDGGHPPGAAEAAEEDLLERALRLGMHRADPVVRQRLVARVRLRADLGARRAQPSEQELLEHLHNHPERFASPARYRLSEVFLSRQRHGEELEADARALGDRLRQERPDPLEAHRLGDPFPQAPAELIATESILDRRFGRSFGHAIREAIPRRWEGPFSSSYGLHYVWVHQVVPGRTPPLEEIRDRVVASLVHDRRHRRRADFVDRLRGYYQVRLVREAAP
jgi:hypothetical protein